MKKNDAKRDLASHVLQSKMVTWVWEGSIVSGSGIDFGATRKIVFFWSDEKTT